jgi:hypothetical protein
MPRLHPQEDDRLEFGQDLLLLPLFSCPRPLLRFESLKAVLSNFGQA